MEKLQNKETFLKNLYDKLGTTPQKVDQHPFQTSITLPEDTLKDLSQNELLTILENSCKKVQAELLYTTKDEFLTTLDTCLENYDNGQILLPQIPLIEDYKIKSLENEKRRFVLWNQGGSKRSENIQLAEKSNIALSFPKFLLAESGTIVVESSDVQGRAFHFLPRHYIAVIPKSKIVPRMTQAANYFDNQVVNQKEIGSCLHFISGPSNSGDIEMQLVTGLHGPVAVTYLVIEDE